MCRLKGKDEAACHNYIRVIAKKAHDRVLICGTNAYKPKCRDYVLVPSGRDGHQNAEFSLTEEKPGEGLCPYDPNHNSTFTFAAPLGYRTDGDLYVGTVGQFSGADPLIYRKPLRTEQFDLKHLNAPQFVSSMHIGSHVYFFFRESAVEFINCGKAIYSRVARVCTNDQGGPHKFKERFTSFLKARLNCSIPGDMPFYFNELQSTSPIVDGSYNGERARLIYSVLTTGTNSMSGSAVCAFRVDDIDRVFHGPFKGQEEKNSNWLPVINSKVPEPRPGQCVNNSKSLPDVTLNFITNHPLMDQAVPSYFGRPIVVHTGFNYRYTYIAVDAQVEGVNGKMYDVLFIGTDHGHVVKVVNVASLRKEHEGPIVVEDVQVFPLVGQTQTPVPVTNLIVQRSPYEQKLIVVSNSEIQGIPLFHCHRAKTCFDCVRLQDPYCAWSNEERKCTHNWRRDRDNSVQSIEEGLDKRCGPPPNSGAIVVNQAETGKDLDGFEWKSESERNPNMIQTAGTFFSSSRVYSAETLAISVTTSIVTSLVLGFIGGYIFARRCKNEMDMDSGPEDYTRYVDIQRMNGLMAPDLGMGTYGHHELSYALPPVGGPRPINLVLNKNGKPTNHLSNPNAVQMNNMAAHHQATLENKTTLQKVKKIYL
ncbi:semaphorin-1A [Galendromus occidentalis]|uniref:Semaphorin-1A n=1 Tax=Galendromus occidentalis TaxID=34638 RepID=A0AAJ7SF36_9ACAR|nr:semaphorin-1A [Galendromus occidentalis]